MEKWTGDADFFIPNMQGEIAEAFYQELKKKHKIKSDERIYAIGFNYRGKSHKEAVGERSPTNGGKVIAIFDAGNDVYYTITSSQGVYGDSSPLMSNAENIVLFKACLSIDDSTPPPLSTCSEPENCRTPEE